MRQRPLGIQPFAEFLAASWRDNVDGSPALWAWGLTRSFSLHPLPPVLNEPDDGLTALVDVDVLGGDFLLSFAAMAIESIQ
jgi:hypothetical protein